MINLGKRNPEGVARIGINDAINLSQVASSFGARTEREAFRRPGGFYRPAVGDPEYFARRAGKVFRTAVKEDAELKGLLERSTDLSMSVHSRVMRPQLPYEPVVVRAQELAETTLAIKERIDAKDLRVPIEGKWLDRAVNISNFALRVIIGTANDFDQMSRLGLVDTLHTNQGLYPGLPADYPVNTTDYWDGVLGQLQPEANVVSGTE